MKDIKEPIEGYSWILHKTEYIRDTISHNDICVFTDEDYLFRENFITRDAHYLEVSKTRDSPNEVFLNAGSTLNYHQPVGCQMDIEEVDSLIDLLQRAKQA